MHVTNNARSRGNVNLFSPDSSPKSRLRPGISAKTYVARRQVQCAEVTTFGLFVLNCDWALKIGTLRALRRLAEYDRCYPTVQIKRQE